MRRLAIIAVCGCGANGVYIDPEDAGPDFAIQGEYAGPGLGAQVVALGGGEFQVVVLPGGLPGDGWDGRPPFPGELSGGNVIALADGEFFTLLKRERQSPTLGASPPPDAIVLFDGTNTDEWAKAQIDDRGFLAVDDPSTTAIGAGAITRRRFFDFSLHLEFRTPFMPDSRGQDRGNSGVFLQNRYEIQVLDSFGQRHGDVTPVGDVCGEVYRQSPALLDMSFPPLAWQTYDIDFVAARYNGAGTKTANARATVRLNGVVVHDQRELTGPTGQTNHGDAESPEPGPLVLQDHETPVFYRNIWIVEPPG